jgi:hypothetical protein
VTKRPSSEAGRAGVARGPERDVDVALPAQQRHFDKRRIAFERYRAQPATGANRALGSRRTCMHGPQ